MLLFLELGRQWYQPVLYGIAGTADNGRMASDIPSLYYSVQYGVLPIYRDAVILQGRIAYLRVDGIAGTATVSQRGTGDNAQ